MTIRVSCNHVAFPASGPFAISSGTRDLVLSWHDVLWAGMTVGRRNWREVRKHGVHSWFEMVYRVGMLWANLREGPGNRLARSSAYGALDQSEKGAISYFLGMTLSKAFADKTLGIPWLVHMSTFTNRARLSPDLIGFRNSKVGGVREWVVVESKGRTGGLPAKLVTDAVKQAKAVPSLSWKGSAFKPALSFAAITYFSRNRLQMHIEDPEIEQTGEPLEVDGEQLLRSYYEPVQQLLRAKRFERRERTWRGRHLVMALIPELDLEVGLVEGFQNLDAAEDLSPGRILSEEHEVPGGDEGGVVVHGDGIAISLGPRWSAEVMKLDVSER